MLKLPLCPYCGAGFLYASVKNSMKYKTHICPHCGGEIQIRKKWRYLLFVAALIVLIGINWFFLTVPAINLPFLMCVTAIGVIITYFLIPYTVQYRKHTPSK